MIKPKEPPENEQNKLRLRIFELKPFGIKHERLQKLRRESKCTLSTLIDNPPDTAYRW